MTIQPSFREVARLAVDGTDSILREAQRRFGPRLKPITAQDENELQEIWAKLTEFISQLYYDPRTHHQRRSK